MKKNKINYLLLLLATGAFFTSCNSDDLTGDSVTVFDSNATQSVAALSPSPFIVVNGVTNVNEGGVDKTLTFSVNTSVAQPVDLHVTVSLLSGDAVEGDDFEFDHEVVIPAWSTSAIGTVKIIGDSEDESMETFTLKVGSDFDANVDFVATTMTFEITDFGDLNLTFEWNRVVPTYEPFTLCDFGYDVDVYVYDANGDDVSAFQAATGACPEVMTLSLADLSDGVYTVVFNVYDDAGLSGAAISPAFDIPMTVSYNRDNSSFAGSFIQDAGDVINSDFGLTAGYDLIDIYTCTITIENGLFTFSKNGSNLATGRAAATRNTFEKAVKTRSTTPSRF